MPPSVPGAWRPRCRMHGATPVPHLVSLPNRCSCACLRQRACLRQPYRTNALSITHFTQSRSCKKSTPPNFRPGRARRARPIPGRAGWPHEILKGAALLRWRPNQSLRRRRGRRQLDPSRRGEERRRVRWPTVLLSSATDGGLPLVLARFVRGLSTHQGSGCPRRLRTAATAAKCHRAPVDSHRVADQMPTGPSMSRRRAPHAASPLPRG